MQEPVVPSLRKPRRLGQPTSCRIMRAKVGRPRHIFRIHHASSAVQ
jgi:hypothetical protein